MCLGAKWKFNPALEILPCYCECHKCLWVTRAPCDGHLLASPGFQWLMAAQPFQQQASSEVWCFYNLQNEIVLFLCYLILSCTFRMVLGEECPLGVWRGTLPVTGDTFGFLPGDCHLLTDVLSLNHSSGFLLKPLWKAKKNWWNGHRGHVPCYEGTDAISSRVMAAVMPNAPNPSRLPTFCVKSSFFCRALQFCWYFGTGWLTSPQQREVLGVPSGCCFSQAIRKVTQSCHKPKKCCEEKLG